MTNKPKKNQPKKPIKKSWARELLDDKSITSKQKKEFSNTFTKEFAKACGLQL